jgi:hypothetical protein
MKNEFANNLEVLKQQAIELHSLTVATCEMCGGSYEKNLNGAIVYFDLNDTHFKLTIVKA